MLWLLTDVLEELTASIISAILALMMEAVKPSETSVSFYQTARRDIPEDSHLHTRRRENLKSHQLYHCSTQKRFIPVNFDGSYDRIVVTCQLALSNLCS
jgi:hypothetical protein